ncbi:hypothetical protein B0T10DRAFT_398432 [Thelonectria olida]|uniref:Uncharacterized protein n=1 Tax=Thelonectria olida TaxID=1576542 RepID=A0A9P8WC50_9HYPO|nr:hypothetical protein B0T10DRAFT_398432 [Thelonectria olida]
MDSTTDSSQPWFLQSSYPVLFPAHDALKKSQVDFEAFLQQDLGRRHDEAAADSAAASNDKPMTDVDESETFTLVTDSTSAEIRKAVDEMQVDDQEKPDPASSHPFMEGLRNHGKQGEVRNLEGMTTTTNGDLTYSSSDDALVDLFQELEEVVTGPRLSQLLQSAWASDPLSTLKIILNARSIHLGKSSRTTFYRCAGWLAQNHPLTLVANLRWLSRPVIEKKAKKEGEDDIVIVDDKDEDDPTKHDVQHGVAHGYWKDLLNILALAANEKLSVLSDPRDVLNSKNPGIIRGKSVQSTPAKKENVDPKVARHQTRDERHQNAIEAFKANPVYRAIHLTVSRLFAEQLEADLHALRGNDAKAKRTISLCGKWAPSHDHFHDKHTFIISSIAEILYPRDSLDALSPTDNRETYLRHAREEYRKDTSALRKHLDIVERNLTARTYENIKYDRLPSIAMNKYAKLFVERDLERFEKYIDKVAEGKAQISGATLLPSTLIHSLRVNYSTGQLTEARKATMSAGELVQAKISAIESKVVDGQWNTLVQRLRDSGTLENCIAVCDVSGSMTSPVFPDKTTPMDSAIGLSLLIAEVTKTPFNGSFITFSAEPEVVNLDMTKSLSEKISSMESSNWGMSTDFVAVFERLLLPMAIQNKLKKEDMVKRVFVFSDMQFNDAAQDNGWGPGYGRRREVNVWTTSYERIQEAFAKAGYDMPELVFWNLAGGGAGISDMSLPTPTNPIESSNPFNALAPKPVNAAEEGTCLVSGYSQALLKVFLDSGSFEEPEDDEDDEIVITKDGDDVKEEEPKKKKAKMNPISIVRKAISHKAYDMLKVVD